MTALAKTNKIAVTRAIYNRNCDSYLAVHSQFMVYFILFPESLRDGVNTVKQETESDKVDKYLTGSNRHEYE